MSDTVENPQLIPLKMASAVVALGQLDPEWNLAETVDEESGLRRYEYEVEFESPFSGVPVVHAGIVGFDIDNCDSQRLSVQTEEISSEGFKLVVQTWMKTRVYMAEISWLALGTA